DQVATAPPELRPAVSIITDPEQLALMWPALKLGDPRRGYPNIVAAEYTSAGLAFEVQMLGGQSFKDWNKDDTLAALADYLAVPEVLATASDPGFVRLEARTVDTLAEPRSIGD
ncbi:hypothetical protein GV794_28825, partial [Nocardia cyriacigeorgica]|nr:hypothetical protein [Nocardia cyriacigeorgica]